MAASALEFSKAGCRFLGEPYSKMDCQAFYENALKEVGIKKNLAGSNAWLREMTWYGTPDECKTKFGRIPKGATLFILKHDGKEPDKYKKDGKGNASHIGIYTALTGQEMVDIAVSQGDAKAVNYNYGDGAINSAKSRGAVCTSKFAGKAISGGWNTIGLWDQMSYGADIDATLDGGGDTPAPEPQPEPEPIVYPTATVVAKAYSTVKMRARPTIHCDLYWDVPIGSIVDVLEPSADWCKIRWTGRTGYMMSEFLQMNETILYTCHVPHLTEDQARVLLSRYPGSWITAE